MKERTVPRIDIPNHSVRLVCRKRCSTDGGFGGVFAALAAGDRIVAADISLSDNEGFRIGMVGGENKNASCRKEEEA